MPTQIDVENAAKALRARMKVLNRSMEAGKRYEAWLMLTIGIWLRNRKKITTRWKDSQGNPTRVAIFRGNGGKIHPVRNGPSKPGYIQIKHPKQEYELHNSVKYFGASRTLHELDLSIIPSSIGMLWRSAAGGYPIEHPNVSLELKHYGESLAVGFARAMILTGIDLTMTSKLTSSPDIAWRAPRYGTVGGQMSMTYRAAVTSASETGSFGPLATYYRSHLWDDFKPGNITSIEGLTDVIYDQLTR